MSIKTLKDIAIDPLMAYRMTLERVKNKATLPIDPTNPYTLMLEATSENLANSNEAYFLYEQKHYPILARNRDELFNHISDADSVNLFASPASAKFRIYANFNNVISEAIYEDGVYRYTIPKYSYITVDGVKFTFMADVKCSLVERDGRYYPYVEHVIDDSIIANRNIGNVPAALMKDEKGEDWFIFDILLSQLSASYYLSEATAGIPFDLEIEYVDQYYHSIVEMESDDGFVPLNKIYVESIFDPEVPSVYCKVGDKSVRYSIPQLFLDQLKIKGKLGFYIFSTKGKMLMDLSGYKSNEYQLTINLNQLDIYGTAATNIDMAIVSTDIVSGGTNVPEFREMKKKVINRTTGLLSLPITEMQLRENAKLNGYKLVKSSDTLLGRIYIACRDVTSDMNTEVKPNLFASTVDIEIVDRDAVQDTISINDGYIVIKPGTRFLRKGSKFIPFTKQDIENHTSMSVPESIKYLNENMVVYNPYCYVMSNKSGTINSRVYDTENPKFDFLEIQSKNREVEINVSINGYAVFKRSGGNYYDIFFRLLGNDDFNGNKDKIKLKMKVPTVNGKYVVYHAVKDATMTAKYYPDATEPLYYIDMRLDDFIENDHVKVINGSPTSISRDIPLRNNPEIMIYSDDSSLYNAASSEAKSYLPENDRDTSTSLGYTIETMEFTMITKLPYLWNKTLSYYTERRYRRYTTDIPKRYSEDVYQKDPVTGCDVLTYDDNNDGNYDRWEVKILHHAGDVMLDENGDVIYEHRAGNIVMDEHGQPVLDTVVGIRRIMEMVLIEYKYTYLNNENYKKILNDVMRVLGKIVKDDMPVLNKNTLDNTLIQYKPIRDITNIETRDGEYHEPIVKPVVKLYVDRDLSVTLPPVPVMVKDIGDVISKYLVKSFIVLQDIEEAIKGLYNDIALVQLSGITTDDRRYINLSDGINRFTVDTKVDSDYNVVYDIDIIVKKV